MRISSGRVALFSVAISLAWVSVSHLLILRLAERALAGQGSPLIRRVIQSVVEDPHNFSSRWSGISWTIAFLMLAAGVLVAAAVSPRFQMLVDKRHGRASGLDPSRTMSRRRARFVRAVIGVVLGASVASSVSTVEWWPFSPYRMYATTQGSSFGLLRLYGITQGDTLDLGEVDDAPPFDRPRFQSGMRRLLARHQSCAWFADVAQYAIRVYDDLHHDEGITNGWLSVRLHQLTWDLDGPARSAPVANTLLCEWTPAEGRQ